MDDDYITIKDAAIRAGYRDDSALHAAARKGKLRTKQFGPRARMTTPEWLRLYLESAKPRANPRGEPKGPKGKRLSPRTVPSTGTKAEMMDARFRLQAFADDWDAPEMTIYTESRSRSLSARETAMDHPLTSINAFCYSEDMETATRPLALPVRHKNDPCCGEAVPPSLSVVQTEALSAQLKALADVTRLRMLDLLAQQDDPLCVCDLTPQFSQNQPTISHHLRILRQAGLIETEKRGIWAFYWATAAGRRCLAALHTLA